MLLIMKTMKQKHFQQLIDPVRHENLSGQDGFEAENTEGRKTCLPE